MPTIIQRKIVTLNLSTSYWVTKVLTNNILLLSAVPDRVCHHSDDIGRRVSSAHQSSQALPVDIHIVQLLYIFQHIP